MEGSSLHAFTAVQIAAAGALLSFVFSQPDPWDWQRGIGAALIVAGLAGIATARYQLGKSFAITPAARQLVTHGIYSKIRNPIYVFGILAVSRFALVLHRRIFWLIVLAIAVLQALRASREAKVLEAAFGDTYREYLRKTWF